MPTTRPQYVVERIGLVSTTHSIGIQSFPMSTQPLNRIYFDTNAAFRWPNPSNQFWQMLNITTYTETDLYFPATVEAELESQFLRRVSEITDSIGLGFRELRVTCYNTIQVDAFDFMEQDELRSTYRKRSDHLKALYNITTVPMTSSPLALFVDMAINRKVPFEEKIVGKEKEKDRFVTGLQDAVIFFSVLEHMKTAPKDARCAFISDDDVFRKAEIRSLIESHGVNLGIIRTPAAAFEDLWDHLWSEAKLAKELEANQVSMELNDHKDRYAEQLKEILQPSQIRTGWFQSAVAITRLSILDIGSVYPDFPPRENLPPKSKYSRTEGSEVRLTTVFNVDVRAIVSTSLSSFNIFGNNDDDDDAPKAAPPPEPPPSLSRKKYTQRFAVTLAGIARGGTIDDIHIVEAVPEKY